MSDVPHTATARAYPNLALVKYWGKADEELMLPAAGSLSLTLDALPTTTTVTLADGAEDRFELNGRQATDGERSRVSAFLDIVRTQAGTRAHAVVTSRNEAPTAAGLASSASGFAALATAAAAAYGLDLDQPGLSRLARRGSGSAARSIVGGLAQWHAGDDLASFAEPIEGPDLHMVVVMVRSDAKAVSSREAMRRTAATSPFYPAWVESVNADLEAMRAACEAKDVERIGTIAEANALRMHAVIASCVPPIRYLAPASVAAFDAIAAMREQGVPVYATADAGPNVVAITSPEHSGRVAQELSGLGSTVVAGPGPGAHLLADTLDAIPESAR